MPRKLRQLRSDLRRAGWAIDRQSGSHQIWKHPLVPGAEVNLAGADGTDAHPYQERDVREAVRRAQEAQRRQQP
jgi:predicted RNA binding protein YcfA (HicA-like mRNA interferase family)